jgi:hypothetical protein
MTSLLTSHFFLLASQGSPADQPILARIVEPKATTLADVVLGAIGLTGVLVAIAFVFALVLAGVLFLIRSHDPLSNASQGSQNS